MVESSFGPSLELEFDLSTLCYCTNMVVQHGGVHGGGLAPSAAVTDSF